MKQPAHRRNQPKQFLCSQFQDPFCPFSLHTFPEQYSSVQRGCNTTTFSNTASVSLVFGIPSNPKCDFTQSFLGGKCPLMPKLLTQLSRVGTPRGAVKKPLRKRKPWAQLQQHKAKSLTYTGSACALKAGLWTSFSTGVPIVSDIQLHKEFHGSLQAALMKADNYSQSRIRHITHSVLN